MSKYIENMDQENQLHLMDIKHLQKENQQLMEQLESESKAHHNLEQLKIEHTDKIEKLQEQLTELRAQVSKQQVQIEKLGNLNKEMTELITEERNFNNEEIQEMEKDYLRKIKAVESKNIIVKNKLT